jgi:hypothetical protein
VTSYVYVSDPLKVPKVEDEEEYEDEDEFQFVSRPALSS